MKEFASFSVSCRVIYLVISRPLSQIVARTKRTPAFGAVRLATKGPGAAVKRSPVTKSYSNRELLKLVAPWEHEVLAVCLYFVDWALQLLTCGLVDSKQAGLDVCG